jgi:hypothetical protein
VNRRPLATGDVAGTWVSAERRTDQGMMTFTFQIDGDGHLEITGTPGRTAVGDEYFRSGVYRLEGNTLSSPVLNDGRPVRIERQGDQLVLTIDETLAFRLRRE